VHKILNNEAYCGTLVLGGRPGHEAIRSGEPPVRIENAWPAIIDREIFSEVQKKMSLRKPSTIHPHILPSFYLLTGILCCSCGKAMIGRSAKSHRYYYYACNGRFKRGKETCNARSIPKDKLEQLVIEQIKEKILNQEWLEELIKLTNQDLDSAHDILKDRLEIVDTEINEVRVRLSKLYDALETGKVSLDDLAPRIKKLRSHQDELSKTRLQIEAEKITQGIKYVDAQVVKSYANDLKGLLEETDIVESKSFLRSFIKRIDINKDKVAVSYNLPIPNEEETQTAGVLPMVTPGGEGGTRTPTHCCTRS
jgi:site-specific DNA recombinase